MDLEEYLAAPHAELSPDLVTEKTAKAFEKLLTGRSRIYYLKVHYLKGAVKALIEEEKLPPFRFRIARNFRREAYMLDRGEIVFSYGTFALSGEMIFTTFLHELSHIWLRFQPWYGELKALDREFRDRFSEEKDVLLSPIEVYARIAAVRVMEALEKAGFREKEKGRLQLCIARETARRDALLGAVEQLKNRRGPLRLENE